MDKHVKYKINDIAVVFEDDWLLIVDKPSGLLTIPTPKAEQRTLTSILNEDFKSRGLLHRLHPCHRLDRETSGLIIYAKGKYAQKKMMRLFKGKKVSKKYIGFVQGKVERNQNKIEIPLEGKIAITKYRVIEKRKNFSIVEIEPLTGRTNQIRIHFKAIGHPLVGERRFAFRKDYSLKARRVCLHSQGIEFLHPITKKHVSLKCELPPDLEKFLEKHIN